MFGLIVALTVQCSFKRTSDIWKKGHLLIPAHLVQCVSSKRPEINALEVPDEISSRRKLLEEIPPVASPIQEVVDSSSAKLCSATNALTLVQKTSTVDVPTDVKKADKKVDTNLMLSGVILTIDIPPSPPEQVDDDDAINELSELLRRW